MRLIRHYAQVALCNMQRRLIITAPPGITERAQRRLGIATAQAVDQYQQMHRQGQQPIGHRFQHMQQQHQQRYRCQHHDGQRPPRVHLATAFQANQLAQEEPITLHLMAQGRKFLDPQRQQQHQKTHALSSLCNNASR